MTWNFFVNLQRTQGKSCRLDFLMPTSVVFRADAAFFCALKSCRRRFRCPRAVYQRQKRIPLPRLPRPQNMATGRGRNFPKRISIDTILKKITNQFNKEFWICYKRYAVLNMIQHCCSEWYRKTRAGRHASRAKKIGILFITQLECYRRAFPMILDGGK